MPLAQNLTIGSKELLQGFMNRADIGAGQLPDLASLLQMIQGLQQERMGLQGITQATPEIQGLARQAAFAPLQGLRTQLDQALLQAANAASSRGLGRGSISAALQAQAVPQIMEPALARAQGLESQLLLDLPFRERQFGLQSLGAGAGLAEMFGGARQSSFANLAQAIELSRAERQFGFQKRQAGGGMGRALGGILGAGLGIFTGGLGAALGGGLGQALFGGGGGGGRGGPQAQSTLGGTFFGQA